MNEWKIGQRCASLGEPTLGLGLIKEINSRNVTVLFPATQTTRVYARAKAPLKRVTFEVGDRITTVNGEQLTVLDIKEQNGILFYIGESQLVPETELDHTTVFSRPDQQLLAGHLFRPPEFDLRTRTHHIRAASLSSKSRGLIGPRIELIPHQLFIADEVAKRHRPRVLLSDEVGLGKTIEAALIFHRLFVTGEVKRVLCLVPANLVNQWLTELYRKFNMLFHIMTPQHAEELRKTHEDLNPYLAHQCLLQDIEGASQHPELNQLIIDGNWDLVIVDEAHHLFWSEQHQSAEYLLVDSLSKVCGGLLLLTATPRQLGLESHFGRLRLLDPERFSDFQSFRKEAERYSRLADIANRTLAGNPEGIRDEITELFPDDLALIKAAPNPDQPSAKGVQPFIQDLVDRHGTGRTVFRNRRKVLTGFPDRVIHPVPLEASTAYRQFISEALKLLRDDRDAQRLLAGAPAFQTQQFEGRPQQIRSMLNKAWREDPRLEWLIAFLRRNPDEKFLLIVSAKSVALGLQEWLGLSKDISVAVFHEELSTLERDRQAAYFAKPEGARVLICSEIGSEGRNFQFANHLILFDLPINPALLEQRIGRLDRIGQHRDIQIFIPFPKETPLDFFFRWYHHGLDAFQNHLVEGDYIYEHLREQVFTLFDSFQQPELLNPFIEESKAFITNLRETIAKGRDRLLELHSFRPEQGEALVEAISQVDEDHELKSLMDDMFELFGVHVEDQDHSQILLPTSHMLIERFPGLPEEGLEITYDRNLAVTREDLAFLTYDHPMVTGVIDLFLNLDRGSTSFSIWKEAPEPGILLQCLFLLESPGVESLGLIRYLPPRPVLITVDQNRKPREDLAEAMAKIKLEKGPMATLHQQRQALTSIVESLINVAEQGAQEVVNNYKQQAEAKALDELKREYDRLKYLMQINPSVDEGELDYIEEQLHLILDYLEESKLRLDAVRLVMMVP